MDESKRSGPDENEDVRPEEPAITRRDAIRAGALAAGAGMVFAPSVRAATASPALSGDLICFTQGCFPTLEACATGLVPGAGGSNVDVRFTFVAECYAGAGMNCPVTALETVDVLNQPERLVNVCAVAPVSVRPGVGANCSCPPLPPTVGAFVIAILIEFRLTGTDTVIHTCSPGKKEGCTCAPTTCP